MTMEIYVPNKRDLTRLRIKMAFWFVVIWGAFIGLLVTDAAKDAALLIPGIAFILAVYFLPTIVACYREHHQRWAILVLNLFLGWTFLGWLVALVWSFTAVRRET